jgi:hypothetical protein
MTFLSLPDDVRVPRVGEPAAAVRRAKGQIQHQTDDEVNCKPVILQGFCLQFESGAIQFCPIVIRYNS